METLTVVKNTNGTYELWYSGFGAFPDDPNATLWDKLFKIGLATSDQFFPMAPTISVWGLAVMSLLLLAAGTVVQMRRW